MHLVKIGIASSFKNFFYIFSQNYNVSEDVSVNDLFPPDGTFLDYSFHSVECHYTSSFKFLYLSHTQS